MLLPIAGDFHDSFTLVFKNQRRQVQTLISRVSRKLFSLIQLDLLPHSYRGRAVSRTEDTSIPALAATNLFLPNTP
jgi:hypothetical protein